MSDSEKITTSCRECIFAVVDDVDGIKKQIDCSVGRLEKFKSQYITKETAEKNKDPREYYLLDGICNCCRTQKWAESTKNIHAQLKREISAKIDIILLNTETNKKFIESDIKTKVEQLRNNQIQPCSITFSSLTKIDFQWYINVVKQYAKGIYHVVNPILNNELFNVIDMCVNRGKANYYLGYWLNSSQDLSSVIDQIDTALNDKMLKFLVIKNNDKFDGVLIQRYLHKILNGNTDDNLIDKIILLNNEQKKNMILNWNDI